jgi:predicted ATPase/DNA-binding SARP family transcriptional activator
VIACRVLGPLEVTIDGEPVDVGGSLPRRLFAALVVGGGRAVPDGQLVDAVWGDRPPPKAAAALQVYVSRLRTALGAEHRGLLTRDRAGYRLRLPPDALDTTWFAGAVEEGRRLLAADRPEDAMRELSEALAGWRGEPYADLPATDVVDAARGRLAELRRLAAEELAAARLSTGDAAGAVAELEELVRAEPLRERRWALLVRGLYRCGRQADALATLRRVRALLTDELGVDPGPELRELERQVLAHDPALDPAPPRPAAGRAVPRPLTSFLGRDAELTLLHQQLTGQRLVTLTGPAGVGKTRTAVEYAVAHPAGTGPWLARLAAVREAADLPDVVADAIGLETPSDPLAALLRVIGDQPALLVLDNCEHLVDAIAELVIALLAGCPRLRVLATSREPLGVDGEVTVPLRPLPLTAPDGTDGAAVALFVERVRAVRPDWTPPPDELAHARRISAALDGLPLAIELAAARARVLGLGEITELLADRFGELGAVPRGSLTPHATLQAAIAWSVDLLADADRALLLRLWPFEGGFTLAAADAVRPADGPTSATSTLESLSALVTRSVVVADTSYTPTRYLLLESIRAYCRAIDPQPELSRAAHARWIRQLTAASFEMQADHRRYFRMLRDELPNIRSGLAFDLEYDPVNALRSGGWLSFLYFPIANRAETLRMLRAVLPAVPTPERARTMLLLGSLTYFGGDFAEARRLLGEVHEIVAGLDDPEPEVVYLLAFASIELGDLDAALAAAARALEIGERRGSPEAVVMARTVHTAAAEVLRACLAGDPTALAGTARRLAVAAPTGWLTAWTEEVLAETCLRQPGTPADRAAEALAALRRSAATFVERSDLKYAVRAVHVGALALACNGFAADAVRLRSAARHHADRLGIVAIPCLDPETGWVEQAVDDAVADALPPAHRTAAEADGATLTWPDMVALLAR